MSWRSLLISRTHSKYIKLAKPNIRMNRLAPMIRFTFNDAIFSVSNQLPCNFHIYQRFYSQHLICCLFLVFFLSHSLLPSLTRYTQLNLLCSTLVLSFPFSSNSIYLNLFFASLASFTVSVFIILSLISVSILSLQM